MRSLLISSLLILVSFSSWANSSFDEAVISRQEWGARASRPDKILDIEKSFFAVHHTAGSFEPQAQTVRSIQNSHMDNRGWADIGYHFLVGLDGKIFEGRQLAYAGAHVGGHNLGSVGISCLGCYDTIECLWPRYPAWQNTTDAMIHAVGMLIGGLAHRYNATIDDNTVKGHREFSGAKTACPGDLIMARLPEIRAVAQNVKNGLVAGANAPHEEL